VLASSLEISCVGLLNSKDSHWKFSKATEIIAQDYLSTLFADDFRLYLILSNFSLNHYFYPISFLDIGPFKCVAIVTYTYQCNVNLRKLLSAHNSHVKETSLFTGAIQTPVRNSQTSRSQHNYRLILYITKFTHATYDN